MQQQDPIIDVVNFDGSLAREEESSETKWTTLYIDNSSMTKKDNMAWIGGSGLPLSGPP